MNDEQFEGRMQIVEVEVSQLMANQLRARDTAQREALARTEAERDAVKLSLLNAECEVLLVEGQRDTVQAQLAEAVERLAKAEETIARLQSGAVT